VNLDVVVNQTFQTTLLEFRDVNLTQNISSLVNYTGLTNESDAPTGQRRIFLFDLSTHLNYSSYNITVDYSSMAPTINNENAIKIYKCDNPPSCTWEKGNSTVNTTANKITATFNTTSRFLISEDGTTSEIVTLPSSGGKKVQYAKLEIIVKDIQTTMELSDEVIMPVIIRNPSTVNFNNLNIIGTPNTKDLSVGFDYNSFKSLPSQKEEKINMFVTSHSTPGEYEIELNVSSETPKMTESTKVFIRLVENVGSEFVKERVVLVEDLFKENPQCLEFNDYLIESEKIMVGNPEKAKELLEYAITGCKDLITSEDITNQRVVSLFDRSHWQMPVMVASIFLFLSMVIVMVIMRAKRIKNARKGFRTSRETTSKKSHGFFSIFKSKKKEHKHPIVKKDIFEMK